MSPLTATLKSLDLRYLGKVREKKVHELIRKIRWECNNYTDPAGYVVNILFDGSATQIAREEKANTLVTTVLAGFLAAGPTFNAPLWKGLQGQLGNILTAMESDRPVLKDRIPVLGGSL